MPRCCWFATQRFLWAVSPGTKTPRKCSVALNPCVTSPSSPFYVSFFFYRSNFGRLLLTHVNPRSAPLRIRLPFDRNLYRQCLERPPGGRVGEQRTFGFDWRKREVCIHPSPVVPISTLNPGFNPESGVQERVWGRSLRVQCGSPFPASPLECDFLPGLPCPAPPPASQVPKPPSVH